MSLDRPFRWIIRRASAVHRRLLRSRHPPTFLVRDVILLTTRPGGAGVTVPLFHVRIGENLYVAPSFGGMDDAPRWYREVQSHPVVVVEASKERREYHARTMEPWETVAIWPRLVAIAPSCARLQRRTRRWIPIVELAPRNSV